MSVRVLCTGDIHMGRRSSKVSGTYRSTEAWQAIVEIAIRENVDLLAISGDVVDKESKSYESLGPLQAGLAKLDQAGIQTVAVTGNHDHDVLERLAGITGTDRFHLLGVGGRWERYTLHRDGEPVLHVDGWSFPDEHVKDAPMRTYSGHPEDGLPAMGLLHGDVGVTASRYAPIRLDDLWAQRIDFWLLGHIHATDIHQSPGHALALYPGSPWALDPGEPGTHGVWMAEFGADRRATLTHLPISPVRYDATTIDLTGIVDENGFQQALHRALIGLGQAAIAAHGNDTLKVVSARLRLTGRSDVHRLVPAWSDQARIEMSPFPVDGISIELDAITSEVRPTIPLADLATGAGPAAETAKLILALDQAEREPVYDDLIERTLRDLRTIHQLPGYVSLSAHEPNGTDDGPTVDDARSLLASQAWDVLSALVAQRETP